MPKPEGTPIININKVPGNTPGVEKLRKELAELRSKDTTPEEEIRVDEISEQLRALRNGREGMSAENMAELARRQAEMKGSFEEEQRRA